MKCILIPASPFLPAEISLPTPKDQLLPTDQIREEFLKPLAYVLNNTISCYIIDRIIPYEILTL